MRALIQRVSRASVSIDSKIKGEIKQGILVLLGVEDADTIQDIQWLTKKINQLRIFSDENGKMNLDINQVGGEFLVISQFTLFAETKKGNRPSYIKAGKPDFSKDMYETFIQELEKIHPKEVQKGIFGADMKVDLLNDGPVTIMIDSKSKG